MTEPMKDPGEKIAEMLEQVGNQIKRLKLVLDRLIEEEEKIKEKRYKKDQKK